MTEGVELPTPCMAGDGSLFDRRHANEIIKQSREGVAHVWADVRSFQFKWIVPYETAFSTRIVRNPVTWVTLLFGFAPLLAGFLVGSQDQLLAWLLSDREALRNE